MTCLDGGERAVVVREGIGG